MKIFSRKKYFSTTLVLMILALGFILMAGPAKVPGQFNNEMFNVQRITIAPIVILAAYGLLIFIIFRKK